MRLPCRFVAWMLLMATRFQRKGRPALLQYPGSSPPLPRSLTSPSSSTVMPTPSALTVSVLGETTPPASFFSPKTVELIGMNMKPTMRFPGSDLGSVLTAPQPTSVAAQFVRLSHRVSHTSPRVMVTPVPVS